MAQEDHDGALPPNVAYRAFQQMYSVLLDGIQAGLSDVVSEVFSKGLISPHTKSVAENASFGDPSRAGTLLSALLKRTKTCSGTFTMFGDVLYSITCFQYLANDMKSKLATLEKEEEERKREYQKEAEKQELKRRELQLHIEKVRPDTTTNELQSYIDSFSSPVVATADMRRIDPPRSQTPVVVDQRVPMAFQHRTPGSTVVSPLTLITITPDSTKPELGCIPTILTKPGYPTIVRSIVPTTRKPTADYAMPIPSRSAPFEIHHEPSEADNQELSSSAPSKIPISELFTVKSDTPPSYSEPPLPNQMFSIEEKIGLDTPTAVVQAPGPISVEPLNPPPVDSSEMSDGLTVTVVELDTTWPQRTPSVESSGSTCSHDMPSLSSWLESDGEVDSEPSVQGVTRDIDSSDSMKQDSPPSPSHKLSSDSMKQDSPPSPSHKLRRSTSCEKCLKKALRNKITEMEKKFSEARLDDTRAKAALESNNNKLRQETKDLQVKVYGLHCALEQHQLGSQALRRHSDGLVVGIKQRDHEIARLTNELKEVKIDAYDMGRALKNEKAKLHRCPTCNLEFIYN